ncbi:KAT8 regulatory NSL complex subunit 3 [Trichinella spiralis]|uniref:KAT8 regulatory NSL complex subunit 3 n=1 Tax=Trichinella spiralis TaxID=6334 RepID=A0A0V1BSF0_TRISP|nr:KAT8 regulatory NSL complex subunit 3 [Trichinella spiralis]
MSKPFQSTLVALESFSRNPVRKIHRCSTPSLSLACCNPNKWLIYKHSSLLQLDAKRQSTLKYSTLVHIAMGEASNTNEIPRLTQQLSTGAPNSEHLITLYEALQQNSRKTRSGAYFLYSQAEEKDTDEFPHIYYQSLPKRPPYSEPRIQRLFHYQPWPTAALPPNISPTERIEGRYFTGVPDNTVEDIGLDYTWRWATKSAKDIRSICAGENYNDLPLCTVWEELVLRKSSENEACYVQSISDVIKKFMLFKLSTKMVYNEHLLVSEKLKKSAHELLDFWCSMYLFKVDVRKVHRLFLTSLPEPYLICYLCILKTMKHERSELVRKVVLPKDNTSSIDACLTQLMGIKSINRTKVNFPYKIPQSFRMDVLMVLFWPTVKFAGEQSIYSYDNCKYFFECLLPGYCKCIDIKCPSMKEERFAKKFLDEYMASMQSKFYAIAKQLQDKRVILVGWHLSCEVVIELLESSSAWGAVLFGFTNKCDKDSDGIVYPRLLKVEQPVLFVVGERARQCDIHQLNTMLNTMKHPKTKAIVIGHANDQLHMDSATLYELHINQMIVNHCLLERVLDYVHYILIREAPSLNEVREFTSGGRPIRRSQKHFEQGVWFTKDATSASTSFSQTTASDRREYDLSESAAQLAVEPRTSDIQSARGRSIKKPPKFFVIEQNVINGNGLWTRLR